MAEGDRWCRGVGARTWHLVRAGAVRGACGRTAIGYLWPSAPGPDERTCRRCVRIVGAAGLAAAQPEEPGGPDGERVELSDGSMVVLR
jgi:hypothetical protein